MKISVSNYRKTWYVIVLFLLVVLGFWGLNRGYWGDESHFVETIRTFSSSTFFNSIKDYPEVTTPLPYLIYSWWGKLFGLNLPDLRLLTLIISASFFILIFHFFKACLKEEKSALILSVILLINPYMWGLSIFVFTDMITLLFIYLSLFMISKEKVGPGAVILGLAVLSRQYSVIFILAVWLFLLIRLIKEGERKKFFTFTGFSILSLIPYLLLILIWKGLSPPAGINKFIPDTSLHWNTNTFITYVTFLAIYILPIIIIAGRELSKYKKLMLPALIVGLLIFLFPVEASGVSRVWNNTETVGLVHKFLLNYLGAGFFSGAILYLFFSLGLWILIILVKMDYNLLTAGNISPALLFSLCIYIFLIVMPFSYQVWEKYLTMVIPVLLLRISLIRQRKLTVPTN